MRMVKVRILPPQPILPLESLPKLESDDLIPILILIPFSKHRCFRTTRSALTCKQVVGRQNRASRRGPRVRDIRYIEPACDWHVWLETHRTFRPVRTLIIRRGSQLDAVDAF